MAAFMPAWRPLDANHSVRLLSERSGGGRVVALCLAPGLGATADGPRLAVALARRWVEGGLDVVLADGDLGRPSLHAALGLDNGFGLADLVLSGGDWSEAVLDTATPGLRLIPAGTGTASVAADAARGRLDAVGRSVAGTGATLGLLVPLGSVMAEWAVEVSSDVVVLALDEERLTDFFARDEDRIRALMGPPSAGFGGPPPTPRAGRVRDAAYAPPTGGGRPASRPAGEGGEAGEDANRPQAGAEGEAHDDPWALAAAMLRAQREAALGQTSPPKEDGATGRGKADAGPWEEDPGPDPLAGGSPAPEAGAPSPEPGHRTEPAFPEEPPLPREYVPPRRPDKARSVDGIWSPAPQDEGAPRRARGRGGRWALGRALMVVGGVAVVALAAWIWSSARKLPPLQVRDSALPRVAVPPLPADPAAEPAAGPETQVPADALVEAAVATSTTSPHQRFTWAVAAMGSYEAARALAQRVARRNPGLTPVVAPIQAQGRTLYRVLGGLAADREALAGVREEVAAAAGVDPGVLLARETPLAFALEDFADAEAAARRAEEVGAAGVDAYVLAVDREDGTLVHRVYAGAYASADEARPLLERLRSAGLGDVPLVERRGRPEA